MKLQNTNELETASNATFGNWELEDELSDADLMAINGGGIGESVVDPLLTIVGLSVFPVLPPVGPTVGGLLISLGTINV